jgi:uncharacterized protein
MPTNLTTDLTLIAAEAKQKHDENRRFKMILREIPSNTLDALVKNLSADISPKIDCTACANCCKVPRPAVLPDELPKLAAAKNCTVETFKTDFVISIPNQEAVYLKSKPCMFLESNRCTIYDERPLSCQDFPHLERPYFKYRFTSVLENYAMCPIVFNVVEQLKHALDFK